MLLGVSHRIRRVEKQQWVGATNVKPSEPRTAGKRRTQWQQWRVLSSAGGQVDCVESQAQKSCWGLACADDFGLLATVYAVHDISVVVSYRRVEMPVLKHYVTTDCIMEL